MVATISATGFVRHLASGQTEIRVTYSNTKGSAVLTIPLEPPGTSVVINELIQPVHTPPNITTTRGSRGRRFA